MRPRTPIGDDVLEARAVVNHVLKRTTAMCGELDAVANRHAIVAPATSEHVLNLTAAIARTVLDWIEGWPS